MAGLKFDAGKIRTDLLPVECLLDVADILSYGAVKYDDNSWQKLDNGVNRYYGALLRHLWSWRTGVDYDDESGRHHLAHVATNALFLLWLEKHDDKTKTVGDEPPGTTDSDEKGSCTCGTEEVRDG